MAFVASHHTKHNIAARVDVSDVSPREPIRIRIGEVSAYLSREEAARLGAELLGTAGAVPVEVAA
jgi:hypothetical protein